MLCSELLHQAMLAKGFVEFKNLLIDTHDQGNANPCIEQHGYADEIQTGKKGKIQEQSNAQVCDILGLEALELQWSIYALNDWI